MIQDCFLGGSLGCNGSFGTERRGVGKKRGPEDNAIGRGRGGLSTKIHMAVRGLGCPVRLRLTAGHRGDAPQAGPLVADGTEGGLPPRW